MTEASGELIDRYKKPSIITSPDYDGAHQYIDNNPRLTPVQRELLHRIVGMDQFQQRRGDEPHKYIEPAFQLTIR